MSKPNLDYIKELAGDDKEFENQFIHILKTEFPSEKATYENAVLEGNFHEAAQIVHKLKHKFNILSMTEAYTLSVAYEEELNAQNMEKDKEFLKELCTIETYLKTI